MNTNRTRTDYKRIIENNLNLNRNGGNSKLLKYNEVYKAFQVDDLKNRFRVELGFITPNDYARAHKQNDESRRYTLLEFLNKQYKQDERQIKKLKYGTNDFRIGGSVEYNKNNGLKLAKAIHDARTPPDVEAERRNLDYTLRACEYIKRIEGMYQVRDKLEPRLKEIDEKFKDEWTKIYWYDLGLQSEWVDKLNYLFYLHRVHVSLRSPLQIAHYPTLRHLRDEREVITKLGKYLTTFKDFIGIDDSVIKSIVEKYNAVIASRTGWVVNFIESTDADGFERVYRNAKVNSCMHGMEAVRVYAHNKSVLRLAHTLNKDGEIIARCIVREDLKQYVRVYPDPNGSTEGKYLLEYLKANGYTHGNLEGCLLKAIPHEDEEEIYVAPYIDAGIDGNGSAGSAQSGELVTIDGKEYIEINVHGDLCLTMTNGYTDDVADEDHEECEDCGNLEHTDDMFYTYHEQHICRDCIDSNYYYAWIRRGEQDYVHGDYIVEVGDSYYHENHLSEHDIYECEASGDYYHIDDLVSTRFGMIHMDYAQSLDHEDDEGYTYVHEDHAHELSDGTWCYEEDAERLQAEIDEEEANNLIEPTTQNLEPQTPDYVPNGATIISGGKIYIKGQTNENN